LPSIGVAVMAPEPPPLFSLGGLLQPCVPLSVVTTTVEAWAPVAASAMSEAVAARVAKRCLCTE
jgi:hypothetical protein